MILNPRNVDTRDYSSDRLGVNFTTDRPISADDLADSFKGMSAMYRREIARQSNAEDLDGSEFLLYITKIQTKCIDAELAAFIGNSLQAVHVMDYTLIIDSFQQRFRNLVRRFSRVRQDSEREAVKLDIPITEAKDFVKMIRAAGNGGITLERRHFKDGRDYTVEEKFTFQAEQVREAYNGVIQYITENTQSEEADKKSVSLYLTRADKDHHGSSGRSPERGIIESIYSKALQVHWVSEMDSKRIKSLEENIFSLIFTVDVNVETVRGKPVSYRVVKLHGWEPMDDSPDLGV